MDREPWSGRRDREAKCQRTVASNVVKCWVDRPERLGEKPQALEDGAIAESIAVVDQLRGSMFAEVGVHVRGVADPTAEAWRVEDVDDGPKPGQP